eukprot:m.264121 g.264121  ORF g.264121 m.264121 type:complete len:59 (+) comp27501_c0_seq1:628-804(+)
MSQHPTKALARPLPNQISKAQVVVVVDGSNIRFLPPFSPFRSFSLSFFLLLDVLKTGV